MKLKNLKSWEMKPFSERNQAKVGVVGGLIMFLVTALIYFGPELPLIGGGTTYTAQFREAAGLKPDDEVRVAGVKVGKITKVELKGQVVLISFRIKGVWVGDQTVAHIKIKTLLGQKNLNLEPKGTEEQDPGTHIPVNRTVTPYDVTDAFADLAETTGQIDTTLLAKSFTTLAETFTAATPEEVRSALTGLSALSQSISTRDQELKKLLEHSATFTKTIADRNAQFELLLKDGATLLQEFNKRKDAITALLKGTQDLGRELAGLVKDNQAQIGPALDQLNRVSDVLQRNQQHLERSLRLAGPFYRLVGNAVGNGRWIDTYICGLVPASGGGCMPSKGGGR
ncbi:phospholipid/cholesterol/gamma-HCH transport system substrate-binding protein [Actinokineospora alba]|uniref:Phospholipid/cholesterol/gamma-HCH transport system substrate-binding protein n=2 Tax=Actinokineospora alba TaxID=504798 RepID=A0A1H0USB1_9PSEU|nr:MCE family protein [Actinokineospora alba]TDP69097.1 phospholipid/cholesterol/gamma-HCH transport system substrate-binding protein [Actinokineospora alba]SDI79490.1 phospholipid/cholesterol/gamma-HCH transport system substrate-binding protein [Actinokineospora alba]SDP69020.1 phospholipid/cholesterol/gamma-HCH transport system substrate-binding protein [Actinokineospora alba]